MIELTASFKFTNKLSAIEIAAGFKFTNTLSMIEIAAGFKFTNKLVQYFYCIGTTIHVTWGTYIDIIPI
jgi:hypothetical protein